MRLTSMPALRAAFALKPTARNWKPRLERLMSHEQKMTAATERTKPQCRVNGGPKIDGSIAVSGIPGEMGLLPPGFCSRPGVRSIQVMNQSATKLSMIVTITSCAPV